MYKVFVDGQSGTTGLQINERLADRSDITLLKIPADRRKDPAERKKYINEADIVFLCLPDDAARESVAMVENGKTRIIDASTAHRTHPQWVYGLPELSPEYRKSIAGAQRVSNPGCYATGFNILVYPLVKAGILPKDALVTCHAVSGYSGGGNKLIAEAEGPPADSRLDSPCFYGLGLNHKHLPEMLKVSGLQQPPLFTPVVAGYYQGMTVAVPLFKEGLKGTDTAVLLHKFYEEYYGEQYFIHLQPLDMNESLDGGFLQATALNGTNFLDIFVFGNDRQMVVAARFDNLGKGASGAAVQNMNIMLGMDESTGL